MKNSLIIILVLTFFLISVYVPAQDEVLREIPEEVERNFRRKFPNAQNVSWSEVDGSYKVECYFRNRATYAEFSPEGEWVTTVTDRDVKTLPRQIQNYLHENFRKDKVLFAEEAVRSDRQDYFYLQVNRKERGTRNTYIVELFFDKTGRLEQIKYPEGMHDMTVVGIDDPHADIPVAVIDSWKRRFPRAENIEWVSRPGQTDRAEVNYLAVFTFRGKITHALFQSDGEWIETRVTYPEKELHRSIQAYLVENHKEDDFINAEVITDADRQNYTYVKMQRLVKGQTRPYNFELFFNRSGQIQKVIRPDVLRNQYLLTVDIPSDIARRFTSRFSGAKEVKWETDNDNFVADFIYRNDPTKATFSDSGEWIETITQMDIKKMFNPVQRYVDQNYSDYRISYAEKIVRRDRNNGYYVELTSRKRNMDPFKVILNFDGSGRPK